MIIIDFKFISHRHEKPFHSSNKSSKEPDVRCSVMSCDDDMARSPLLPLTGRALKEHLVAADITWPED